MANGENAETLQSYPRKLSFEESDNKMGQAIDRLTVPKEKVETILVRIKYLHLAGKSIDFFNNGEKYGENLEFLYKNIILLTPEKILEFKEYIKPYLEKEFNLKVDFSIEASDNGIKINPIDGRGPITIRIIHKED